MQELLPSKYMLKTLFISEITGHCVLVNLGDNLSWNMPKCLLRAMLVIVTYTLTPRDRAITDSG